MFTFENFDVRMDPFPIGAVNGLVEKDVYAKMLTRFPEPSVMAKNTKYNKFYLSEGTNGKHFRKFLNENSVWNDFNSWIKSSSFLIATFEALKDKNIDLGIEIDDRSLSAKLAQKLDGKWRSTSGKKYWAKFEFSSLPVDGGFVAPHTDAPQKIVTIVLNIVNEGEWQRDFGGGTDLNIPLKDELKFNHINRSSAFDDLAIEHTYEFAPNQAVVFVKTFNSWHSVRPMQGKGRSEMRKSVTINIIESN